MCWCTQSIINHAPKVPAPLLGPMMKGFLWWVGAIRLNQRTSLPAYSYTSDTTESDRRKVWRLFSWRRRLPGLMIGMSTIENL